MQSMNQVRLLYFNELNTAIDENKTSKHLHFKSRLNEKNLRIHLIWRDTCKLLAGEDM